MVEERKERTPPTASEEETFLDRWSRRKRATREEPAPRDETAESDTGPASPPAEGGPEQSAVSEARQPPADDELPPPESLGPDSDFSAYLSGRVSSGLRRAAMRRLFSLPDFNIRDGLDDYDEDYTNFQSLGKIVTAQMKHQEERRRERERVREEEERRATARSEGAEEGDTTSGEEVPAETGDTGTDTDRPQADTDTAANDSRHDDDPDDRS